MQAVIGHAVLRGCGLEAWLVLVVSSICPNIGSFPVSGEPGLRRFVGADNRVMYFARPWFVAWVNRPFDQVGGSGGHRGAAQVGSSLLAWH